MSAKLPNVFEMAATHTMLHTFDGSSQQAFNTSASNDQSLDATQTPGFGFNV